MNTKSRTVVRLALTTLIVLCAGAAAACKTVQGLGEDVSNAGKAGERAIDKASN